MKKKTKDPKAAAIIKTIDDRLNNHKSTLLKDLHDQISSLNPYDENTLQIAISALLKSKTVDQTMLAKALRQSRAQIARWASGAHASRNEAFRGFLVGKLLQFMLEEADKWRA